MSRHKAVIAGVISEDVERADTAQRELTDAQGELTMIRRRIRTFYAAITQVSFPASPPSWAEDWVEWLETGEVAVLEVEEVEAVEVVETEVEIVVAEDVAAIEDVVVTPVVDLPTA